MTVSEAWRAGVPSCAGSMPPGGPFQLQRLLGLVDIVMFSPEALRSIDMTDDGPWECYGAEVLGLPIDVSVSAAFTGSPCLAVAVRRKGAWWYAFTADTLAFIRTERSLAVPPDLVGFMDCGGAEALGRDLALLALVAPEPRR